MPRIGIRVATVIPPVAEVEPEAVAVAGETSWSSLSMVAAMATGQEHVSGLLIEDRRRTGETNSLDGSIDKTDDGSTGPTRRRSRRRRRGNSGCGRSRPLVSNLIFLPSIIFTCLIGFASGGFHSNSNNHLNSIEASTPTPLRNLWADPYFDIMMPKNVTALVGKSAYLTCRVRNLGNRTVAWVRHRDIHVLTVSTYTYTSDQRFQTAHHKDTDEWTLHIKWAQPRDAGKYECQVSTQPVKSYIVSLNVVEPKFTEERYGPPSVQNRFYNDKPSASANDWPPQPPRWNYRRPYYSSTDGGGDYNEKDGELNRLEEGATFPTASILGGPDLYVDKGSTINLTCAIRFSPEPPAYIFWYHLDEVISYDSTRGGIAVITDKGEGTTSYLLIQEAQLTDSGKYSCAPSNAEMASVRVHVLNGERPEAMQTGSAGLSSSYVSIPILIIISSIYNSYRLSIRAPATTTPATVFCAHR